MQPIGIPSPLDVAARSHPDRVALEFERSTWTYAELQRAAAAASVPLAGTPPVGRIGILSANRAGLVIAIHASARLGMPIVPLNWRQSAEEITWQAADAGVTVLLCDEQNAATANAIASSMAIPIGLLEKFERQPPKSPLVRAPLMPLEQDAAIIYTSGTGGRPKGARITFGNLWYAAVASSLHIGHHEDDVWLAVLPLFHIGGLSMVYRAAIGATGLIVHERFDPADTLSAMEAGVTLISLAPVMLQRLIDANGDAPWPPGTRCMLIGGAPTPEALIEECIARGIPAAPTYGLTESTAQIATMLPGDLHRKPGSSGIPLPLTELRIVSDGRVAEPGTVGEIEFSGPTRFAGYLGNPISETDDRWFKTGDAGYLDDEGYLYVVDRRDDLIVSGGENIYPAEIERVLMEHPRVLDAGVVGIPDPTWGARPVAFIVWDSVPDEAEEALRAHCRERLASFKSPDRITFISALPRTASGKVLRRSLREMAQYERQG